MMIGFHKEIEIRENRVSCTPAGARMFIQQTAEVFVGNNAGTSSGFSGEINRQAAGFGESVYH